MLATCYSPLCQRLTRSLLLGVSPNCRLATAMCLEVCPKCVVLVDATLRQWLSHSLALQAQKNRRHIVRDKEKVSWAWCKACVRAGCCFCSSSVGSWLLSSTTTCTCALFSTVCSCSKTKTR
jgi:hypothetical protein